MKQKKLLDEEGQDIFGEVLDHVELIVSNSQVQGVELFQVIVIQRKIFLEIILMKWNLLGCGAATKKLGAVLASALS